MSGAITEPILSINNQQKTTPNIDYHSVVQITSIRLNGDNFLRWSQCVRIYIRGRGKIGYLIGDDKKKPAVQNQTYATWDAENSMVMTWLVNSMDEDISSNYMCFSTAKELWDNVNQIYSDLGNQSQVYELTLNLGEIRQGDDYVTKYFKSLKRLCQDMDLFNDYEWKSTEDAEHNRKTVEAHRIYKFLARLNVEFDEVRGRIIGRSPLSSIGEVFAELRREESRKKVMLEKKIANINGDAESSALMISDVVAKKAFNFHRKTEEKPRVWCDHCNKPRHTRETCWKIHGKPKNWKSNRNDSSRIIPSVNQVEASPFNKEQIDHLLKLLNSSSSSCISNVSLAHTGSESNALFCFSNLAPWIIDFGLQII